MEIKKNDDRIEMKNDNNIALVLFLCGFLMVLFFIVILVGQSNGDPIGAVEIILFVAFLAFLMAFAYLDSKKVLIVNNAGVTLQTKFKSDYISWADVKDYGVSYYYYSKSALYYCLYFSQTKHDEKNEYSKKLKGKMIRFEFIASDYKKIVDTIIPYCTDRTTVAPFIGKEKR